MKPHTFTKPTVASLAFSVALLLGCQQGASKPGAAVSARENPVPVTVAAVSPVVSATPAPVPAPAVEPNVTAVAAPAATNQPGATNMVVAANSTNAPAKSPTAPLRLTPAAQEVVRLVQAGVSEEVLMAYIDNAPQSFDLTANEIVYLNDLGVENTVITAMLRHRNDFADRANGVAPAAAATAVATNLVELPPGQQPPPPAAPPATALAQTPAPIQGEPTLVPAPAPQNVIVAPAPEVQYVAPPQTVSYNYFYDSLSPYGSWTYVTDYGWCWQPTAAVGRSSWQPYCDNGRWLYTDNGWYWHSYYSWGWAPFHYGRWHRAHLGWVWVPDTNWGPAWVTWRQSRDYCGWAPLPPGCTFDVGIGLRYRGVRVGVNFDFGLGHDHYTFVGRDRFYDRSPWHHALPRSQVGSVIRGSTINNTYIIGNNNTVINNGVSVDQVRASTRNEVRKVNLRDINPRDTASVKPDQLERNGTSLAVYRPQLPKQAAAPPSQIIQRQEQTRAAATATAQGLVALPTSRTGSSQGNTARPPAGNPANPAPGRPVNLSNAPAAQPQTPVSRASQPGGTPAAPATANTSGGSNPQPPFKRIEPRRMAETPATPAPNTPTTTPAPVNRAASVNNPAQPATGQPGQAGPTVIPARNTPAQPVARADQLNYGPGNPAGTSNARVPAPGATTPAARRGEDRAYVPSGTVPAPQQSQTPTVITRQAAPPANPPAAQYNSPQTVQRQAAPPQATTSGGSYNGGSQPSYSTVPPASQIAPASRPAPVYTPPTVTRSSAPPPAPTYTAPPQPSRAASSPPPQAAPSRPTTVERQASPSTSNNNNSRKER